MSIAQFPLWDMFKKWLAFLNLLSACNYATTCNRSKINRFWRTTFTHDVTSGIWDHWHENMCNSMDNTCKQWVKDKSGFIVSSLTKIKY